MSINEEHFLNPEERAVLQKERENFVTLWRQSQKTFERIGGLFLFLSAAVLLVTEQQQGDSMTMLALASFIAGGFTLIMRSSRAVSERRHLSFIKFEQVKSYGTFAFMGMCLFLGFGFQAQRPLFLISGGILLLVSLYYQWLGKQLHEYGQLFVKHVDLGQGGE